MNLKQRFSFIFSCLFSIVLATVTFTVYNLFSHFRQDEFTARLAEKAETTAKLLIQVKEVDYNMQKIIDRNTINDLYNEKTQVYDGNKKLIYNSSDTAKFYWSAAELETIKVKHRVFEKRGHEVLLGLYNVIDNKAYYVVISAEDSFDKNLNYLRFLLLGAFLIGTIIVWVLSFSLSKKALKPLDNFSKKIQGITDGNLKVRLSQTDEEDEMNTLAHSFNQMMDRINNAYNRQREFTNNASHELRTPLARISAQIENLSRKKRLDSATKANLKNIFQDTFQLSEVISSLLAIADINSREHRLSFASLRLDEVVFSSAAVLSGMYPDFRLKFEIENNTAEETDLEIAGDETLLKIAITNLFKNAYIYSDNRVAECIIIQHDKQIKLIITNSGETPDVKDTATLFTAFYRGSNIGNVEGSGIGLGIVKRIIEYHNATIAYSIVDDNTSQIIIVFMS
ncbi:HAMP domain-containing sensor histidine kinase [Mucilaginibacter sp. L196]|uniref:HAMP domain-containing sensor histidine kinase n=1 Tax=Mucilaginibacter sp. L196 TaxID=1641870 RepID=UPI00131C9DF8|nr:HAMP domain-containing sensor histidine kinase [Mucilaginibacter sp. L196]